MGMIAIILTACQGEVLQLNVSAPRQKKVLKMNNIPKQAPQSVSLRHHKQIRQRFFPNIY